MMSTKPSLLSIFNETKSELASVLSGLTLPKDAKEIQSLISMYLNKVCDEDNEFRQNLTQSEDYILQAALSMLNAQRDMVSALCTYPKIENKATTNDCLSTTTPKTMPDMLMSTPIPATNALLGGGGGALLGKLIFGGWGAVFGAIAGTAVALYLSQQAPSAKPLPASKSLPNPKAIVSETPVNIDALLNVIR
ncbi:MAG: hypothetical protein K2N91_01035, partial [Muribaculaceae bacterium]|nr:hypothetical protein [Muribaculaceae bacterium]